MAHYAFLDENNVVTEVIAGVDETELIDGLDPETWYGNFRGQVCKRTSINTISGYHREDKIPFRKNYAGVGYTYNYEKDAFIAPQPFPSWILDEESCTWQPPISRPQSNDAYGWNEENKTWDLIATFDEISNKQ
jgi:hypothetical protein